MAFVGIQDKLAPPDRTRWAVLSVLLAGAALLLLWRAVDLHVMNREFLGAQGAKRSTRIIVVPAHRGMITDRNGEPLAISTPVQSVWANPLRLAPQSPQLTSLAEALGVTRESLVRRLAKRSDREFFYLKRQASPAVAALVRDLDLPGLGLTTEYRRYYPASEIFGHVIGFTDVDDRGQEGIELAFDEWLRGMPGRDQVIRDGRRRVVENVEHLRKPRPGQDLRLSLERRLQFLTYQGLADGVRRYEARAGSAVLLDVRTGEVLAMANQPAFNPNSRKGLRGQFYRNRAVTDQFEPGSTVKPFTVAAALTSGAYTPRTVINTGEGQFRVGRKIIRDIGRHGVIDVATVLRKSSNVGASKIALALAPRQLWEVFASVGFGEATGSGFPGESAGVLSDYRRWRKIDRATLGYGYGISVTPLQLARAYAVIAADGRVLPVSFVRQQQEPLGHRALSREAARQLRAMLEGVVSADGTGSLAAIPGYRVAGKTGTVHKLVDGGYADDRYLAVFAGMAPASKPRLVLVIMIDEPSGKEHFGGQVAAPIFARVMRGALRMLDIPPDDLASLRRAPAAKEGSA